MSIDSASSPNLYRKKTLKSPLSQSVDYSHSKYSLQNYQQKSRTNSQTTSGGEETSDDVLTDLSSLPYISYISYKQENQKRTRRYSELKPSFIQPPPKPITTTSNRRNSTPQINFSAFLPNPFRSHKHQQKNTPKDETNTSIDTSNNVYSLFLNDTMSTKPEPLSASKTLHTDTNGSRTNLSLSSEHSSTISHEDSVSSLFILDPSHSKPRSAETFPLELNTSLCVAEIYREHFYEYFHTNYCGELHKEGPFIASLRYFYTKSSDENTCQARAIIRIPSGNSDVSVVVDGSNEDNILQVLFNKAHLSAVHTYKFIGDPKANEKIYSFDKSNDEKQSCKIGFIYQHSEQTDESDIFNNDDLTDDMVGFLQMLADRVRLKGFDKYRGDLDVKNDLHGEYSYYTEYNNHEIMFNVGPMIPSLKAHGQCVKRKGLVGNSFVCIVFQESDAEFIPDFISGKVTQIYITVQPTEINEQIYYKIGIWHRHDVTSTIDPPGGIYACDKSFRDYFLTLLLNAMNVAIESPSLRFCIAEQRQRSKHEELKKLSQNLSIGQILDTLPDVDNNNNNNHNSHLEQRSISRNDHTTSSSTPSTNDSIVPSPNRIPDAPVKKRTLSKILSVFTNRSGSLSIPSNISNHDPSVITPPLSEVKTVRSSAKDPIKRAASVKDRAAPAPPASARVPVSYKYSMGSTQSGTPPLASTHSIGVNSFSSTNDNLTPQNISLNPLIYEETVRSRSSSSPGDHVNTPTKRPLSTVSKETSDTSSSVDDSSDDDFSDEDKYEHRPTLTELSLVIPSNSTS